MNNLRSIAPGGSAQVGSTIVQCARTGTSINPFANPKTLTLYHTRGGADGNVKMQSPDDVVEAVLGTQGDEVFQVSQMPDRAGLALGGANLLGIDALRKRLLVFALLVGQFNYDGGVANQLSNPINIIKANIDGSNSTDVYSVDDEINNMQQNDALITITKPVMLDAGTLIKVNVIALNTIRLVFSKMQYVPYNDPNRFGYSL